MKLRDRIVNAFTQVAGGLAQKKSIHLENDKSFSLETAALLRYVAAEGAVLLENRVLPFAENTKVSVFGRNQIDYFYTGYGSGGDVNKPYTVNLLEGVRECEHLQLNEALAASYEAWCKKNPPDHGGWGTWPRHYVERKLDPAEVVQAAQESDAAVVVIGRSSGEDRDSALEPGSYYLTSEEKELLNMVTDTFKQTVVLLNIGGLIDFTWVEEYGDRLGAVCIIWQGGMESGNAAADILCGNVSPSGHLTATAAKSYDSYPSANAFGGKLATEYTEDIYVGYRWFETFQKEQVIYPFGYGLTYTTFTHEWISLERTPEGFTAKVKVLNTGNFKAKDAVCLYLEKPCAILGNPARSLIAFAKTDELAPNSEEVVTLTFSSREFSSYDASGATGYASSFVIEAGKYQLFLGGNVREAVPVWSEIFSQTRCLEQYEEAAAPREPFNIVVAKTVDVANVAEDDRREPVLQPVTLAKTDLRERILSRLPQSTPISSDRGFKLQDVKLGRTSMQDFVSQLSLEELEAISHGDYAMDSPLGPKGNAGAFGGILPSLREKGVLAVTTTDGPSGIRLAYTCSLIPIGMLLASTFNPDLIEELYNEIGLEMKERETDILLAPGMNIQRNPLCGRNFEYFSEDPLVTGKIGAAAVNGLQKVGVSACPKHFACNNQEFSRNINDSRVSERALREIYLRGFEICVKEAAPQNIMTSYNKINGVWGHYHYELCTTILRDQWGYTGNVMTDWWMQSAKSPEFPAMQDNAYRVRAQVDVLMPGGKQLTNRKPDGTLLKTYGEKDGITLGEMQRTAANVLRFVMNSSKFKIGD